MGSCNLLQKDDDIEATFEPGFGESDERPVGTPFLWPNGIILFEQSTSIECEDEAEKKKRFHGIGNNVALCLTFQNLTDQSIRMDLPPGLVWISESLKIQNGLLVKKVSIEVPAKERYFAYLNLFCINGGRSGSGVGSKYEEVPIVSSHPGMKELYKLLESKKVNYEQYGGGNDNTAVNNYASIIRSAVGDLRSGYPINEQDLKRIKALPEE